MDRTMMIRRIAAGAVSLSLLAGGGVLAGCGSGSSDTAASAADAATQAPNGIEKLPAKEILSRSLVASKAASSVTVVGTVEGDGPEWSLDLVLGTGVGQGTMSIDGTRIMEFRETGGKMYSKFTREGAESIIGPGDASKLIGGRWVVSPTGTEGAEASALGEFGDKDALLASLVQEGAKATTAGTGDVKGTPVVFVRTGVLDDTATVAIRTVGEPYIIQVKGDDAGSISFSDWNAPVNVTAPTGAVSPDEIEAEGRRLEAAARTT
jgi:hypothetical protein